MRASAIATDRTPRRALAVALGLTVLAVAPAAARAQRPTQGDDESGALVADGRQALTARDYRAAARALDEALAVNPRRLEAYVLRAAVHAALGEHALGVAVMRRARELAPDDDDVLSALGTQLVLAGAPAEGVPLLEKVVVRSPRRYEASVLLGHHYADAERWADAAVALERYFAARPAQLAAGDDRHRLDLAEAYLRTRQPARARDLYRGIAARHRDWLTAHMGLAWATAAVDCRQAQPLLTKLARLPTAPPEVELVRGQCALELGDPAEAVRHARGYLRAVEDRSAAGHALVGEAEAVRGNLPAARTSLTKARTLEPRRRRFAVRLARVLRLGQDPAAALVELDAIGAPAQAGDDPGYWIELGEALLADGQAAAVATRLGPAVAALGGNSELRTVVGAGRLRSGDAAGAVIELEVALAASPSPRTRALLASALLAVAAPSITNSQWAPARVALVRAAAVEPTPAVLRNLGLVELASGDAPAAVAALERSSESGDPATWILLGRAQVARGDLAAARTALTRGLTTGKGQPIAVDAALELASLELAAGRAAEALAALTEVAPIAGKLGGETTARWQQARSTARHAAGLAALRDGQAARAVALLEAAGEDTTGAVQVAIRCDLALATVAAGDRERALTRLKAIARVACPFPAPADTQAVPVLIAFVEGLQPRRAARALVQLAALQRKATGPAQQLLATATRVIALHAADDAYRGGKLGLARTYLAVARKAESRAAEDEVRLAGVVIDVADGKLAGAAAALERLAPQLPEALISLGVVRDRQGDGARALEAWRRARQQGARFAPLDEWIAAKERIWGGAR